MKPLPWVVLLFAAALCSAVGCESGGDQRTDTRRMEELRRMDAGGPTHLEILYRPGNSQPYFVAGDAGAGHLGFDIDGLVSYVETNKYAGVHIMYPDDMERAELHFSNLKPLLANRIAGKITATWHGEDLK